MAAGTETTISPRRPSGVSGSATAGKPRRRRPSPLGYLLILPSLIVMGALLGFPLYRLTYLSFTNFRTRNIFNGVREEIVGFDNYTRLFGDELFRSVLVRTFVFTAVNVGLTLLLGTLLALLLQKVHNGVRVFVTSCLVLVWSMPVVVAVTIWQWMVDPEFGVLNYAFEHGLGLEGFHRLDWFEEPLRGFAVITAVVVWGALPFVVITLYAGLTQVPSELVEAARLDGAGAVSIFKNVTFPILKPLFIIVTSLSVIWDFGVFTQVYVMLNQSPSEHYYLLGIYTFIRSFANGRYGAGAAIAIVIVITLLLTTIVYIRQMVRMGEVAD